MASIIKLKRFTTTGAPTTDDLSNGEVGINVTDEKIYVNNGGTIVEVANTSGSGVTGITQTQADARYLQLTGGTLTGSVIFNSSPTLSSAKYLQLKDSTNIIGHNGVNNLFRFTDSLQFRGDTLFFQEYDGTEYMRLSSSFGVQLKHQGSTKLQIESDGITVTGTINDHTIPSGSGTIALTSDVPTNNNELTNGAGYITGYTVTESDVTTHEAALSITESQISDLQSYLTSSSINVVDDSSTSATISNGETLKVAGATGITTSISGDTLTITGPDLSSYLTSVSEAAVTAHEAALSITESQITDLQSYLTSVSQSDVTQHQAALSITESQISDLQTYLTSSSFTLVDDGSTSATISNGETLKIAGATGITTSVSGDTLTITGTAQDFAYSSLTGTPTNVSDFTNDAGYITSADTFSISLSDDSSTVNDVASGDTIKFAGATGITTSLSGDTLTITGTAQDFAYSSLTGAPTNVSDFTNDSGFITSSSFTVVDDSSTASTIATGETLKVAGATGVTTAISGDTLTVTGPDLSSYLQNISEDSSPQLGANLDLNSNNITGTGNITTTGTLSLTNTTTDDSLLITTTEDSSSAGPVVTLKRNSSSPADGDYIGQLKFKGENDADQEVVYAKITGKISDNTDTTEDGLIEFALRKAGSNNIGARLTSTRLKLINGTGLEVGGYTFPTSDGSANQILQTNGSGTLSFNDLSVTESQISDLQSYLTSSSFSVVDDSSTSATIATNETLKIAGGTNVTTSISGDTLTINGPTLSTFGVTSTSTELNLLDGVTGDITTSTNTQTIENKTLRNPTFESGANSPEFLETRYVNATQQDFVQLYTGGSNGSYFTQGEYQKIATITPDGNFQNYTFIIQLTATSASNYQIVTFTGGLRANTLPDLDFTVNYSEEHNGVRFIEPKLWTKETSTAAFILAFEYIHSSSLFGGVNVNAKIIPRSTAQRANVSFNTTQDSEQTTIDTGFTERDPTLTQSIVSGVPVFGERIRIEGATDNDFETTLEVTDPTADRTITFPDKTGTVALTSDITGSSFTIADDSSTTSTISSNETLTFNGAQNITVSVSGDTLTITGPDLTTKADKSFAIAQAVALG